MRVSYAPYRRELAAPFVYGDKTVTEREGYILRLDSPLGPLYSEVAPLPGHSYESFAEVGEELAGFTGDRAVEGILAEPRGMSPSLRCALEGFQAQLFARSGEGKAPVESNALVSWKGVRETLAALEEKKKAGYGIAKIKVSASPVPELLDLLRSAPAGLRLRLDANRAWPEESLREFFRGLGSREAGKIDYFEEPLPHWRSPLLAESPVALAADECAADPRLWPALLVGRAGPSVFVLKPMVSGGFFSLLEKAEGLERAGKRVVFSTALETEPGRRCLIAFLHVAGRKDPSGLSTGFLYRENHLADRPVWQDVPAVSEREQAWLDSLPWRELP